MCCILFNLCTFAVQIIYGIVSVIVITLTATSLGADSWYTNANGTYGILCINARDIGHRMDVAYNATTGFANNAVAVDPQEMLNAGQAVQGRFDNGKKTVDDAYNKLTDTSACNEKWFNDLKGFEKGILIALVAAIVIEVLALAWNFFTLCACCCKSCLIPPMSLMSLLAVICLATAVGLFGANNAEGRKGLIMRGLNLTHMEHNISWDGIGKELLDNMSSGGSFIIAIVALVVASINTVIAATAVFFAKKI